MQKRNKQFVLAFVSVLLFAGCGYSTHSVSLGKYKTICVEPFKNKISYENEKSNTYLPLLEVKVTHAIIDRYLFDGGLKIAKKENADLVLQGDLVGYQRDPLRYDDNNDVQEYRITITIAMTLWDNTQQKEVWRETSFSGDTTYFTSGPLAKSESTALEAALKDVATRVIERTVEAW